MQMAAGLARDDGAAVVPCPAPARAAAAPPPHHAVARAQVGRSSTRLSTMSPRAHGEAIHQLLTRLHTTGCVRG